MTDSQFIRSSEVSWGSLRPILQEMADRIARLEQALAAAGLQAPSQPMTSFVDVFDSAPASFGPPLGPAASSAPSASVGQVAAAAHGVNLGGDVSGSSGQIPDYIVQMVRSNRKIEAIKELRNVYGIGLKEAKDIADGL